MGVFSTEPYTHFTAGWGWVLMGSFVASVLGLCVVVGQLYPDTPTVPRRFPNGLEKELGGPGALLVRVIYALAVRRTHSLTSMHRRSKKAKRTHSTFKFVKFIPLSFAPCSSLYQHFDHAQRVLPPCAKQLCWLATSKTCHTSPFGTLHQSWAPGG